jgi:hypothetical protein
MKSLTPERLAASAYRTLGLSASASQAQIDQAARRLRIWPDLNSVPPTPWDLLWLGPVARGKKDIEHALALLNEPATRIEERLIWFHTEDPKPWSAGDVQSLDSALRALSARKDPASLHDYALVRVQLAMLHDTQLVDQDRWGRALQRLRKLSQSDDYLAWLLKVEAEGDFEKRAQIEEVSAAMKALPDGLAGTLATKAQSALEEDDLATAGRVLGVLRAAGNATPGALDYQTPILDRLEDLVNRRCNQLHQDLDKKFQRNGVSRLQGQAFCGGAAKFYNESIDPVLSQVYELVGLESDRTLRARTTAARAMAHMGQCWAMCGRLQVAEQTLDAAAELGRGTPVESMIRGLLEQVRQSLNRQRASAIPMAKPVGPVPAIPVGLPSKPVYTTTGGSGGWGGRSALIVALIIALRGGVAVMNLIGHSRSSSPATTRYPYSSPTYTTPAPPSYSNPPRYRMEPGGHLVPVDSGAGRNLPFGPPPMRTPPFRSTPNFPAGRNPSHR